MMGKTSSAGEFFEADNFLVFVVVVHRILLQFWVNNSKVISLLMNLLVSSSLSMPSHIMVAFYASSNGKAQILVCATAIPYHYARLAEKLEIRNWPTR
jgi:hypothetical protein